jgi:hypothetical protein
MYLWTPTARNPYNHKRERLPSLPGPPQNNKKELVSLLGCVTFHTSVALQDVPLAPLPEGKVSCFQHSSQGKLIAVVRFLVKRKWLTEPWGNFSLSRTSDTCDEAGRVRHAAALLSTP